MATITTGGSGNWNSTTNNAPWPGGTLPTAADDVVIANTHTVTLNVTTAVALSLTINNGGTFTVNGGVSTILTLERDLINNGTFNADLSSDVTKTCSIILNNANSAGAGSLGNSGGMLYTGYQGVVSWKGFTRNRWTTTTTAITTSGAGSTSFDVTNATGWQVNDRLVIQTTSAYNATPKTDVVTITGLSGNSITSFTGTGTGGVRCSNVHASGCYIINTTSNLKMGPKTAGWSGNVVFYTGSASTASKTVNHVQFESLKTCSYFGAISCAYPFLFAGLDNTDTGWVSFDSNAFYDFENFNYGMMLIGTVTPITRSNNVHYHPNMGAIAGNDFVPMGVITATYYNTGCVVGNETDVVILSCPNAGISGNITSGTFTRPKISGVESAVFTQRSFGTHNIIDPDFSSVNNQFRPYFGTINVSATNSTAAKLGTVTASTNVFQLGSYGSPQVTLTDCNFQSGGTFITNGSNAPANTNLITLVNGAAGGNTSVTSQEIYHPYGTVKRNNSTNKRSTSSLAIAPTTAGVDTQYTVTIPCANGASIKVVGYCQVASTFYNSGTWTAPTCVISGLGITPVTFTATSAASGAWEQINDGGGNLYLSATNSSGADGNFTLTFTANKLGSSNTGNVYFDGIPTNSPFVTKARNYGYLFDQTTPNVTDNITKSASEATALGYASQFTITGGTSTSSTAIIDNTTFQKYYDYTQAWSCATADLNYVIPVTGAGLAGSPVLFAQGNVTISTTKVMNGSGSLNMGSYTLTAETATALPYTYTGGSFSQATTQPAFSGGTLTIGAAATYTFTMESGKVVATPTSASNYVLSNGTFTGSNVFWNTTAYNITVEIPAGATFSSAGSPGAGTVTFVAPVEYQSVTVTGFTAGSRIYIKDVTSGTVLCNATASTTNVVISGSSCVWTDPSAASATRQIALRIAYVSGATAKVFIDNTNIGTCATSGGGKDVSYIASQSADTTYNSNAVDGSTVTGITFTDAATDLVVCNLAGGSTTWPRIYAAFVYWLSTSTGIDDDVTYISAPDTANYLLTAMKIRNANATPLTITSGYGRSATTGLVEDIIDVAGSTGNIYPEPNHVVPYQTTGTYAITGDISTVLTSIGTVPDAVLAAAAVDPIAADVKKVLGTSIQTGSTSTASIGY